MYRSRMRFQALPYLRLVAGSRWYLSYLRFSCFSCSGQKRPSVRLGQPGWEHGRFGFLGMSSLQMKSPRGIDPTEALFAVFYATTISGVSPKSVRDIGHHGLPKRSTESFWSARFFLLYAEVRSMLNRSQMSYTELVASQPSE